MRASPPMLCDGYALVKAKASPAAATDEEADAQWFPRNADEAALRRRYKELARKYHPDVLGPDAGETELLKFQELILHYVFYIINYNLRANFLFYFGVKFGIN